jgi:Sec-independent protein secretion pathway component TatC
MALPTLLLYELTIYIVQYVQKQRDAKKAAEQSDTE